MAKVKKKAAPEQATKKDSQWVTAMHDHYHRTRSYRAEDLEKVMGDPREGVEMPSAGPTKGFGQNLRFRAASSGNSSD